jgi:hypothetical protein
VFPGYYVGEALSQNAASAASLVQTILPGIRPESFISSFYEMAMASGVAGDERQRLPRKVGAAVRSDALYLKGASIH